MKTMPLAALCLGLLCVGAAQPGPASTSALTRLPLTKGAIRVTDAEATRDLGDYLTGLAKGQGSTCQASEYLVWSDPDLAEQIAEDLAAGFRSRAMTLRTLDEAEDEDASTLSFLLTEKANRWVGLLYADDESVLLGWCQLRAAQTQTSTPAPRPASPPASAGVKPQPGTYTGDLTGDFKGNTITFQVGADGRTITNVRMTGYWRCSDSLSSSSAKLNPRLVGALGQMDGTVAVQNGSFSHEAKAPSLSWEFAGRFVSPGQAQGTFLVQSMECTSYKLNFTATRR